MKALIDGDLLVYRGGFAGEEKLEASLGNVKTMLRNIRSELDAEEYDVFLTSTDRSNFRFSIAETKPYKENRKEARKPRFYNEIREYLKDRHSAKVIYGEEADDAMGIAQGKDTIICSIDKDLNMVPGWHYNFVTGEKYEITDKDPLNLSIRRYKSRKVYKMDRGGVKWFYAQMLLGDSSDNIPGIRGLGPVAVDRILRDCYTEKEMAETVWKEYKKRQLGMERFLEVADLLWIRREVGQLKSGEVKCLIEQKS